MGLDELLGELEAQVERDGLTQGATVAAARKHVMLTGHDVWIERTQSRLTTAWEPLLRNFTEDEWGALARKLKQP